MTHVPDPNSPFGPARGSDPPKALVPTALDSIAIEHSDPSTALEAFESLLLIAAAAPMPDQADLGQHPLVLVQAAKAMIGLRPDRPSKALMAFAIDACSQIDWTPADPTKLVVPPEELGLTVSVYDLETALASGDESDALAQFGRILMVSDSRNFLFDILLAAAADDLPHATEQLPLVHSCQRAYDFVGSTNFSDFIIPAIEAVAATESVNPEVVEPVPIWSFLNKLIAAPVDVLHMFAHSAQILDDEHVKGPVLERKFSSVITALVGHLTESENVGAVDGTIDDLLAAGTYGDVDRVRGMGRHLAILRDRSWLLDVVESVDTINADLILWADAIRMLLRVAPEEQLGLVGEIAGAKLVDFGI